MPIISTIFLNNFHANNFYSFLEVFVPSIENGEYSVFGCVSVFLFFVFHSKSASKNNHRSDLSGISY